MCFIESIWILFISLHILPNSGTDYTDRISSTTSSSFELDPNDAIYSLDGNTRFTNQGSDGNFVLRTRSSSSEPWIAGYSTKTNGNVDAFVALQADGNLVVYTSTGNAIWGSGTNVGSGLAPFSLVVSNGGYAYIIDKNAQQIWSTPTDDPTLSPTTDPTLEPSYDPTLAPTKQPTTNPTKHPTNNPTKTPTKTPTNTPTNAPTNNPSILPTRMPTKTPSRTPTV
eukprot:345372_1